MQIARVSLRAPGVAIRMWLTSIVLCVIGNAFAGDDLAQRSDVNACLQEASSTLPDEASAALARIDGTPRKLLALRSYLRARNLESRWSWTEARISKYQGSPEQLRAQAALARVQARFSQLNPGYSLYVNSKVRSLDTQLARWDTNASVGIAADALAEDAEAACALDASRFARWLKGWHPPVPANLAAPGLSSHGQARAFDFQVQQGGQVIAGTDARTIDTVWKADGWARRLAQAIKEAGPAFDGPLRSPREPWHYAFHPQRVTQKGNPGTGMQEHDGSVRSHAGEPAEAVHDSDCD